MNHSKTITYIMEMLLQEYGANRFRVTPERVKLWEKLLEGFGTETILAAVTHLVSMGGQWAPTIGQIREQCLTLSSGRLSPRRDSGC